MFNRIEHDKKYRLEHRDERNEYNKKYCRDNSEKIRERRKQYYEKNKEKLNQYNRLWYERNKEYRKEYFQEYRERFNEYWRYRYKTDLKYNLNNKISAGISQSLKKNKNGCHWENLVNFTLTGLIKHLKKTMPQGYAWKNYLEGKLHIDHIIPIRAFEFKTPKDKEFKECWSLYNLRLLPAKENRLKQKNIINPILLGLLLKEAI